MSLFDKFKAKVKETIEETKTSIRETVQSLRYEKLKEGLSRTREGISEKIDAAVRSNRKIDDALLDELEESLLAADVGTETTIRISDNLRQRVRSGGFTDAADLNRLLREEVAGILHRSPSVQADRTYQVTTTNRPHVIMIVGVNGVGKTTTIGKLAHNYKTAGYNVLIAAADTFRAAANEQLEVWAGRAGVDIIGRGQGGDPASVAYDALQAGIARSADVMIVDTAGRLHTKTNLMEELRKMVRVMQKLRDTAPDEIFIVLDATIGQNAVQQAREFTKAVNVTGIVLTKLDGTARGGVVLAIADTLKIPVRYIGVGEGIDDLQPFDPDEFARALFNTHETEEEKPVE